MSNKQEPTIFEQLYGCIRTLLANLGHNQCEHTNTVRLGAIWTKCEDCGRRWADDEGGFKPYEEPQWLTEAWKLVRGERTTGIVDVSKIDGDGVFHGKPKIKRPKHYDWGYDTRFFVWAWDANDVIFFDREHKVAVDRDGNSYTLEQVLAKHPGNEWCELVPKEPLMSPEAVAVQRMLGKIDTSKGGDDGY